MRNNLKSEHQLWQDELAGTRHRRLYGWVWIAMVAACGAGWVFFAQCVGWL